MKDRKHLWGKTSSWSPPPGILRKSNRTVNKVMSTHTRISLWVKEKGWRNINLPFRFGFFGETEEGGGGGGGGGERRLLRAKGKRHAAKTNYDAKKREGGGA